MAEPKVQRTESSAALERLKKAANTPLKVVSSNDHPTTDPELQRSLTEQGPQSTTSVQPKVRRQPVANEPFDQAKYPADKKAPYKRQKLAQAKAIKAPVGAEPKSATTAEKQENQEKQQAQQSSIPSAQAQSDDGSAYQKQAEQAYRKYLDELEIHQIQQERETEALIQAARELDGTDHVPPAEHRPMLQTGEQYLDDEQLLELARLRLPEMRRRERIVEKAQAIEATTVQPHPAGSNARTAEEPTSRYRLPDLDGAPYTPWYLLTPEEPQPATSRDKARRYFVTGAWAVFVIAGVIGLGLFPGATSFRELHDGAYTGAATYFSMVFWHTLIWPVLWLATGMFVAFQWKDHQTSTARQRNTGWLIGAAMLANAMWFVLARFQNTGLEALVWLVVPVALTLAIRRFNQHPARSRDEHRFMNTTINLYTGWAIVFTGMVVFTALRSWNLLNLLWLAQLFWAILMLVAVIIFVPLLTMTDRGRMGIALGLSWGMLTLIVARLLPSNFSLTMTLLAGLGAFIVILTTENRRYRIARAERLRFAQLPINSKP